MSLFKNLQIVEDAGRTLHPDETEIKPMPDEGERVLALYNGEWIVLEVGVEYPTFEETFDPYPYWFEPFNDSIQPDYYDVPTWVELPPIPEMEK